MDLKKIKEIINNTFLPDDFKEQEILKILSLDENVIPHLLDVLKYERKRKKKLVNDINFQLSRAHLGLEDPSINESHFMDKEIIKFYQKNIDQVGHLFKTIEKPKEGELDDDDSFYSDKYDY